MRLIPFAAAVAASAWIGSAPVVRAQLFDCCQYLDAAEVALADCLDFVHAPAGLDAIETHFAERVAYGDFTFTDIRREGGIGPNGPWERLIATWTSGGEGRLELTEGLGLNGPGSYEYMCDIRIPGQTVEEFGARTLAYVEAAELVWFEETPWSRTEATDQDPATLFTRTVLPQGGLVLYITARQANDAKLLIVRRQQSPDEPR